MNRSLLLISLLLVFTGFKQSESFTAVWQKLQQLMKIHPRAKFDKNKCAIRPKKLYGHFVDPRVNPNEIHNFYINEHNPYSDKELGKNLELITRRILKLDPQYSKSIKPFVIYRVEACIPNENFLRPSWE